MGNSASINGENPSSSQGWDMAPSPELAKTSYISSVYLPTRRLQRVPIKFPVPPPAASQGGVFFSSLNPRLYLVGS